MSISSGPRVNTLLRGMYHLKHIRSYFFDKLTFLEVSVAIFIWVYKFLLHQVLLDIYFV